ncbi:MAG: hypothetical protein KAY37_17095 [Phycisphaerae bacterium]|nr:hypothetical protein [Phycisphaerae bacterium]
MSKRVVWTVVLTVTVVGLSTGCALTPNYYREDGPSVTAAWDSPTAADVKARYEPLEPRHRAWGAMTVACESGAVAHYPLYFEDPFEDKGHGRTDATQPHNVYRLGWEDWLAIPYGISRFTANWLLLPVSAVVTPPGTVMESDGRLSRQLLGYDHDALPRSNDTTPPSRKRN